jgi:bilin biosynthesis protein
VTPADVLDERKYEPFCGHAVLAAINALADYSHSKAMADLVTAGRWKGELLVTLGKVGPPRYAHFIGRYKDDPDRSVRQAVAAALGLIDSDAISVPVLAQLLSQGDRKDDLPIRWEASSSLAKVTGRKGSAGARRRLLELLRDRDTMTVVLAARALAVAGDAQGSARLRELTSDGDVAVRQEAVLALGEAADKGSRDVLTRRLNDESLVVRQYAIYALGRLGDPSLIPTLQTTVEDYEKQHGQAFGLRETLEEAIAAAKGR